MNKQPGSPCWRPPAPAPLGPASEGFRSCSGKGSRAQRAWAPGSGPGAHWNLSQDSPGRDTQEARSLVAVRQFLPDTLLFLLTF